MTLRDSERERLIRSEEQLTSALRDIRALERELNVAKIENQTLRSEAKQYTAVKDQYGKGIISYLFDIVKLCLAIVLAVIGVKYGVQK